MAQREALAQMFGGDVATNGAAFIQEIILIVLYSRGLVLNRLLISKWDAHNCLIFEELQMLVAARSIS